MPAVEALVLESTPAVLSIGRRCMEQGYTFEWKPRRAPTLRSPNGAVVTLEVIDNIPYLRPASRGCGTARIALPVRDPLPGAGDPEPVPAVGGDPGRAAGRPGKGDESDEPLEEPGGDLKEEAVSLTHLLTHHPKNKWCQYCMRAKMPRVHCRVKHGTGGPPATRVWRLGHCRPRRS
jgi:hypothetical protein